MSGHPEYKVALILGQRAKPARCKPIHPLFGRGHFLTGHDLVSHLSRHRLNQQIANQMLFPLARGLPIDHFARRGIADRVDDRTTDIVGCQSRLAPLPGFQTFKRHVEDSDQPCQPLRFINLLPLFRGQVLFQHRFEHLANRVQIARRESPLERGPGVGRVDQELPPIGVFLFPD